MGSEYRKINITIGGPDGDWAYVRGYPNRSDYLWKMPTYTLTVSGTEKGVKYTLGSYQATFRHIEFQ